MRIEILGAESLGVRGLCCLVETGDRKIVIDPGVALGFRRHGLLPHPVQVAASAKTRKKVIDALQSASDVVISHFHGDHIPLVDANPYQLSLKSAAAPLARCRLWVKGTENMPSIQVRRANALAESLGRALPAADGLCDGILSFSSPVPHGDAFKRTGDVMMTRVEEGGKVFVQASDIQMLNDEAVEKIILWQPNIVIASGPPLYLPGLVSESKEDALRRTLRLAGEVNTLILDHHLLRSREGEGWLDYVSSVTGGKVICAADFMGLQRNLLEAKRDLWYRKFPVPEWWHEAYARGEVDGESYFNEHGYLQSNGEDDLQIEHL